MKCKFCKIGEVSPCKCGCAENGNTSYVCSNPDCKGHEFEILGVSTILGNSWNSAKKENKKD